MSIQNFYMNRLYKYSRTYKGLRSKKIVYMIS